MNIGVQMKPNFGPYLPNPIRTQKDVDKGGCADRGNGWIMCIRP